MEKFIIEGGHQLSGTLIPGGNKNEVLPARAASLLTTVEVILHVPRIKDVEVMMEIIRDLGGEAGFLDEKSNSVRLCKAACFSSIPLSLWAQRLSSVTRTASSLQERANSWARASNPPTSAPAWRSSSLHSAPKADPLSIIFVRSTADTNASTKNSAPLALPSNAQPSSFSGFGARFAHARNTGDAPPALRMRAIRGTGGGFSLSLHTLPLFISLNTQ